MLLLILLVLTILYACNTQDEPGDAVTGDLQRGGIGKYKKLGKGTGKRSPKKMRPGKGEVDSMITQALAIHYPLSFFDTNLDPKDWYVYIFKHAQSETYSHLYISIHLT